MKWLVLWSLWLSTLRPPSTRELPTSGGVVRGVLSFCGRYQQFLSIPYAYTNRDNRFQAPLSLLKWDGIFDAINEHVRCSQRLGNVGDTVVIGQEDCLTLNIYTPTVVEAGLLPVMVHIHGGGFFEGSSQQAIFGPEYIVTKNVILVAINYRLKIQGFLCLGIKEAPGNAGLKDQVAALKWIQKNIKVFGGDPNNVTIFGESAGAASVSYHIVSPMSKGLFHKAIMQSGSSLSPWALQTDPILKASRLAQDMGHGSTDPYELYRIFMNKTDEEMVLARIPRPKRTNILSEVVFAPCIEKDIDGVEPFLTEMPYELMARGDYNKVPVIIGHNSHEGLLFVAFENDTTLREMRFDKMFTSDLDFTTEQERLEAGEHFKKLYMGDDEISKRTLLKLSKMYSEQGFIYPQNKQTELLLKSNDFPIYNYKFKHSGWLNYAKIYSGFVLTNGATHVDELFYLYQPKSVITPFRFLEWDIIEKVTSLWTNFAKFSDPTPETSHLFPVRWQPTTRDNLQALVIKRPFSTEPLWNTESLIFWNETYSKYRRRKLITDHQKRHNTCMRNKLFLF